MSFSKNHWLIPLLIFLFAANGADSASNQCDSQIELLPMQISGYQLAVKSIPPDNLRKTVVAYTKKVKVEFAVCTNQTLDTITLSQKNGRLFALLETVANISPLTNGEGWRGSFNFLDAGELVFSTNQAQQVELRWSSLFSIDELGRMRKGQVSVAKMAEWMGNLLLEVKMPISKEGYTTTYESRSTTYDIQRKEFNPPISSFCQIAESVLTEKGKGSADDLRR